MDHHMSRIAFIILCLVSGCAKQPHVAQAGEIAVAPAPAPAPRTPAPRAWADTARPLSTLSKGWNRIPGRQGTGCAHDSTFAFKVRPGLPDKVMIFLNGGGACWRAAECDPKSKPATYTMTADSANDASIRQGIFDVANEANPVRDYTMIYIPYCTGDVHLGTRTVDYEKGSKDFAVRHEGAANLEAVLDWVYSNIKSPRLVFVAGSSTGAIASPVVAAKMARR